jgi:hypothetical protein
VQQFAQQTAELTSSAVLLWPKHFRLHRALMDRVRAALLRGIQRRRMAGSAFARSALARLALGLIGFDLIGFKFIGGTFIGRFSGETGGK